MFQHPREQKMGTFIESIEFKVAVVISHGQKLSQKIVLDFWAKFWTELSLHLSWQLLISDNPNFCMQISNVRSVE